MARQNNGLRPINEWIKLIEDGGSAFYSRLNEIYGDDDKLKAEAAKMCLRTIESFARAYGTERSVVIARSTGRINLMGTHIDHRGGSVNPITVKQMWLVIEPRNDDLVLVKNVESSRFADEQFQISDCLPAGKKIKNWDTWCHDELEKRRDNKSITWSNYVRAAVLYFQHLKTGDDGVFTPVLKGMNMMFYGDIPTAAGLSSSSAVVMVTTEAVVRINGLAFEATELIEHCGYAEWYVGTRGGCGDQAAIKFGKANAILHITAVPMTVESIALPAGYKMVLANSFVKAKKRAGARNIFNSRVAGYEFGLMIIRKNFPQYADKLQRLCDVRTENLGVDEAQIYRIIKSLPVSATREKILELVPECEQQVRHIFRSHDEPEEGYKIRQVCLYGITECVRADMVPKFLRTGDMEAFGELMSISHDGDRVTKLVDGERQPIDNSYPDARIDAFISDLESGNGDRAEQALLWRQGGGYNVSVPEIDTLVDIALATPGVVGTGLVGAGMGGSIVAVVEEKYAQQVVDNMAESYYRPKRLPVEVEIVSPVGGLCTIEV
ncbi:MAG: galactokinase [Planctomycetota bacterium]|jgi:N-acetylgalactosamine kinase